MSYSETFRGRVSGSETVHYGASEHGGSKTVHWSEDVYVTITVEDDEFNNSVHRCIAGIGAVGTGLGSLTLAQIEAKAKAANQISSSIISGFFDYTKNTFNQQIVELENICTSLLPQINTYQDQLADIKKRMEFDYNVIKNRYLNIFSKLDDELYRQIYQMYSPCFEFVDGFLKNAVFSPMTSSLCNTLSYSSTISNGEVLLQIAKFKELSSQVIQNLSSMLNSSILLANKIKKYFDSDVFHLGSIYVPTFIIETERIDNEMELSCYIADLLRVHNEDEISKKVLKEVENGNVILSSIKGDRERIGISFSKLLDSISDERKREEVFRLWTNFCER